MPLPKRANAPEKLTRSQAEQIAHLLNENNNLRGEYDGDKILRSTASYHPEHFEGLVFGSVAVQRLTFMLSEIKHLVVHHSFRRMGLGKRLLSKALLAIDTPLVCATIREENVASLALFHSSGFVSLAKANFGDHKTWFLLKANEFTNPRSQAIGKDYKSRNTSPLPDWFGGLPFDLLSPEIPEPKVSGPVGTRTTGK